MAAYYNEIDPYAAQWLRNLIEAGQIAPGYVDERDIRDVSPSDLIGFTQCHFFAGVGVWSYALRQAGWHDDRSVWTGSCPCQPFSAAGKGDGFADERHLWPAFFHLISVCKPSRIFGEQVASKDGLNWLDLVHADLETARYAFAALDLCAAGVGAPHIRQRLFFVADADNGDTAHSGVARGQESARREHGLNAHRRGDALRMADAESLGLLGRPDNEYRGRRERASRQGCEAGELEHTARDGREQRRPEPSERSLAGGCGTSELGDADKPGLEIERQQQAWRELASAERTGAPDRPGPTNGHWRDADWLGCTDGRWRSVEPGTFPLVGGVAESVGRMCAYDAFPLVEGAAFKKDSGHPVYAGKSRAKMLKGYGNAIVAPLAAEFIAAYLDAYLAAEGERLF